MPDRRDAAYVSVLPVPVEAMEALIPALVLTAGYHSESVQRGIAAATRQRPYEHGGRGGATEHRLVLNWRSSPAADDDTILAWVVDVMKGPLRGQPASHATHELRARLQPAVDHWWQTHGGRPPPQTLLVGPGEDAPAWEGPILDYGGCATEAELCRPGAGNLADGVLPLGRFAFGRPPDTVYGKLLSVGYDRYGAGGQPDPDARIEYRGTIVCAPPGSGKTEFILRWAEAAIRGGYSTLIVDVAGNMRLRLEERLRRSGLESPATIYHFSTDRLDADSDRINFLAGLEGEPGEELDNFERLATVLLPSRGFEAGEQEMFYGNRVRWLSALIGLVKLSERYWLPEDAAGRDRDRDLSDVYELAASQDSLEAMIEDIAWCERKCFEAKIRRFEPDLTHFFVELEGLLRPDFVLRLPNAPPRAGKRELKLSHRSFTENMLTNLRPFHRRGALYGRISGEQAAPAAAGRRFRFEDLFGSEPVTIILTAPEHGGERAATVLSMAIARFRALALSRFRLRQPRPILLLLDETRRIKGFDPNDYIAFARGAKAAAVLVYQELNQVAEQLGGERKVEELLQLVGTQIYLGSLAGSTYRYFSGQLKKRDRQRISRTRAPGRDGVAESTQTSWEKVEYLDDAALASLAAGRHPALVYMRQHPCGKPFLVDMDEALFARSRPRPASASARARGHSAGRTGS